MKKIIYVLLLSALVIGCLLCLITACANNCTQMGHLHVGMTEEEALKIMGRDPDEFNATGNTKSVYYSCRGKMPNSGIKFIDGKLVAYGAEEVLKGSAAKGTTMVSWSKPGVTEEEFKRDLYECTKKNPESSWSAGGGGLIGLALINRAESKSQEQANKMVIMCMEALGYKQGN